MGHESERTAVARSSNLAWPVRYGGALLAVSAAVGIWALSPTMHRDPFAIFVLGVVFIARFVGFGPAVFATALSVVAIEYVTFEPHFTFSLQSADLARLVVFVVISLLAASLARQRSRAEVRADQTWEQMAAIVESSEDAIYSSNAEGTVTSWNHGAEQLYGYQAEEALGQSVLITVPPGRVHETRSHLEKLTRKKIQTKKEFEQTCEIRGFAGELRQLFSNLIVNAVDAMEEGGQLRLRVACKREWNGTRRPGVRVIFADNGGGISREDRARVFEPFYTTKGDTGTGLGLWLSEGIVRKHGGQIRVRSCTRPGHSGTVFSVFLPSAGAA